MKVARLDKERDEEGKSIKVYKGIKQFTGRIYPQLKDINAILKAMLIP